MKQFKIDVGDRLLILGVRLVERSDKKLRLKDSYCISVLTSVYIIFSHMYNYNVQTYFVYRYYIFVFIASDGVDIAMA